MNDPTETGSDDVEAPEPEPESTKPSSGKLALIGAGVALVAIVIAAQRDIATQPNLRGPRWLWHAVATTPPGVVLYGMFGPKGHPFGDLPTASVRPVTTET